MSDLTPVALFPAAGWACENLSNLGGESDRAVVFVGRSWEGPAEKDAKGREPALADTSTNRRSCQTFGNDAKIYKRPGRTAKPPFVGSIPTGASSESSPCRSASASHRQSIVELPTQIENAGSGYGWSPDGASPAVD
jgi:hypothetical protein